MLLGVDLPNIDIIIFLRPFNQVAALIQEVGEVVGRELMVLEVQFRFTSFLTVKIFLLITEKCRLI